MKKLDVKLATVVDVDWLTHTHTREKGLLGLGEYILQCYGVKRCSMDLLISGNDRVYDLDLVEFDDFDREEAEEDKEDVIERICNGSFEDWELNSLLTRAILDGHLTPARYLVSVSW